MQIINLNIYQGIKGTNYTYSKVFYLYKEGKIDLYYNTDESCGHYPERNKPVEAKEMLCDPIYTRSLK